MNINDWKQAGDFFDFEDLPVFYRRSEAGDEVLLCLHGFPTSSYDYHKIWLRLADRFAVLAFDMIGYGFSAKPLEFEYTTFQQVDLLQALLKGLGVKRSIFWHMIMATPLRRNCWPAETKGDWISRSKLFVS